jgi:hypothetical protein
MKAKYSAPKQTWKLLFLLLSSQFIMLELHEDIFSNLKNGLFNCPPPLRRVDAYDIQISHCEC